MGRSTTAQLKDRERHVTLSQHETDAPILPIAQIERLRELAPDRVEWFFDETTKEGDFRRAETSRVNGFVFVERLLGILAGLFMGSSALYASYHLAMAGHDWVAAIIGGTTVVGLVSAFVVGVRRRTDRS
ncbi:MULTISPECIES: hypothetical protein [Caldimonas]|uniref:hypothetical protein n=1 Tax=Caldimonas TaxID=196013 RepID=UPI00037EC11B|nr:hypothetical protein [Caldimonas manganoxidans]MCX7660011.1 hypothetical protein [Caldimonas manganoxidans]